MQLFSKVIASVAVTTIASLTLFESSAQAFTLRTNPSPSQELQILLIGDSNTRGKSWDPAGYRDNLWSLFQQKKFNVSFVGDRTWCAKNRSELLNNKDCPKKVDGAEFKENEKANKHAAVGGATINDLHKNGVSSLLDLNKPRIALLMAGTNDLNTGDTAKTAFDDLKLLVSKILPSVDGLFVSTIQPFNNKSVDYNSLIHKNLYKDIKDPKLYVVNHNLTRGQLEVSDNEKLHPSKEGYTQMATKWFESIVSSATKVEKDAKKYDFDLMAGDITATGNLLYGGPFGKFTDESILNENATWNISFTGIDLKGNDFGFRLESGSSQWEFDNVGGSGSDGDSFFKATENKLLFGARNFTNLVGTPLDAFGSIVGASKVDFSLFGPASGKVGFDLFSVSDDSDVTTERQPFSQLKTSGNVDFTPVPEPGTILGLMAIAGIGMGLKRKSTRV
ncbi:PEP-CTERM sorting domain-containing protein [Lusitaniella coriacea LEGE 07157]|uniref:PEP-CTERM sorting domain-containing protein n=1 Tax=Lusitaniella coriacea LEGE 07157 TaxID=945747 RepID=A0A8J7DU62_9CYAN|nr:SGNH/GDSL hydrolase family protein [Lusitaniella coriacea]MBE9115161.1 PEP-CTERM sorting domain-containing protein [Lusitaniella coriacea LEGE 07157]